MLFNKKIIKITLGLFLVVVLTGATIKRVPQFDPCQIYGSVYFESSKSLAQYSVFIEDSEGFADVIVFPQEDAIYADRIGNWHITDQRAFADFILYAESTKNFADFSVYYTDIESFAGCAQ